MKKQSIIFYYLGGGIKIINSQKTLFQKNVQESCAIYHILFRKKTQNHSKQQKTLGKNHKIYDFSPEFCQNKVETVCTPSLQTAY